MKRSQTMRLEQQVRCCWTHVSNRAAWCRAVEVVHRELRPVDVVRGEVEQEGLVRCGHGRHEASRELGVLSIDVDHVDGALLHDAGGVGRCAAAVDEVKDRARAAAILRPAHRAVAAARLRAEPTQVRAALVVGQRHAVVVCSKTRLWPKCSQISLNSSQNLPVNPWFQGARRW